MSDTNGGQTVTLGGQEIPLKLPPSPAMRLDIFFAAGRNLDRAACAALGACWGSPDSRPRASIVRAKHDPLEYGGQVGDSLLARGHGYREIIRAAGEAFMAIEASVRPMIGELAEPSEVEAAEDFTEAPAANGSG